MLLCLGTEGDRVEHGPVLVHDEPPDHAGHVAPLLLLPVTGLPLAPPASARGEPEQVEDRGGEVVHDHL